MKKEINYKVLILLLFTLTATGCSKTPSEDSYVEGTDYQYQYYDRNVLTNTTAKGQDAMYFFIGSYIYQLDEGTDTLIPLCNKPNCLHDKEKDESKLSECNAYLRADDNGIAYMNRSVYYITTEWVEDDLCSVLYKTAENGSTRERVYQWEGTVVESWCLHRNTLYYVEHTYDENNDELYAIKEMNLTGMGKLKAKTIWEPDEDITVIACSTPIAYGNHLYITVDGAKENNTEGLASEEDWIKYSYKKTFQYNLEDKTLSEIQIPNQTETQKVQQVTFWQNRIIYKAMDLEKQYHYDSTTDVYIADLDGSNAEVLIKDVPMYRVCSSDGTYLYVSDYSECITKIVHSSEFKKALENNTISSLKWDYKVNVDIYDKDMELVDSVTSPFHNASALPTEPSYGIGDKMYIQVANESGDGVSIQYWDKTKIGTYHGSEYKLTKLCEQTYSEVDLQKLEDSEEE